MPADGPLWVFEGVAPRIASDCWIAPTATVIGDVEIGAGASVWWHCVLRGDTNAIRIGAGSNIQDGSILHVNAGNFPCLIGRNVTVGHACIIHACTLEDGAFGLLDLTNLLGVRAGDRFLDLVRDGVGIGAAVPNVAVLGFQRVGIAARERVFRLGGSADFNAANSVW